MGFVESLDLSVHEWPRLRAPSRLDSIVVLLTELGGRNVLAPVVIIASCWFLIRHRYRAALIVPVIGLIGNGIEVGVKRLVQRPRPEVVVPLVPIPASFSFPSGHALNATTIYVTIALLLSTTVQRRWLRNAIIALGLTLALITGLTRVYLGVHYLSDVIGGWTAGLMLALFAYWLEERGRRGGVNV